MILLLLKGGKQMSRSQIDPAPKDKTTIVTNKTLLDRVTLHCKQNEESQTDFITRALVNQLEREGDFSIRAELESEE